MSPDLEKERKKEGGFNGRREVLWKIGKFGQGGWKSNKGKVSKCEKLGGERH